MKSADNSFDKHKGTTIIRQAPKQDGGFDTETVTVQEDFWHVIDALAVARLRE